MVAVILERAMGEKTMATCRQIVSENIPSFIRESIINQARKRIREEKPLRWNLSTHFDFNDEELRKQFEQMLKTLLMSVKFTKIELEQYIESSVRFNLNLRIRPIETLEKGLFITNETLNKEQICRQLEKLNISSEISKQLAIAISKSAQQELDRKTFKLMAKQTVDTVFNGKDKNILVDDFKELVEFYFFGNDQLTPPGIDSALVKDFLSARGMGTAISIVEKKEQQGKRLWRTEDIPDLYFKQSIPDKYGAVPEETSTPIVELVKKEKKKPSKPKIIFSSQEDKITIERKTIERQPPGPYPPLGSIITNKDQKTFVKRIFKNDIDAYIEFIKIIDNTDRWKTAKQIIDTELERRDIDTYSKEALKLGDRVFSKFFSSAR